MTATPAETTEAKPTESQETTDAKSEDLGEKGIKALQSERNLRQQLEKALSAAEAKLKEHEDAKLGEVERLQKQAQEAADEVVKARQEALRFRIAAQFGISDEDAELFLTGTDEETVKKQAERLIARTPSTPRPDPSQGASSGDMALNGDPILQSVKTKLGIT